MTSLLDLINEDNILKSIYGQSTPIHFQIGAVGAGDIGTMYEPMIDSESSEKPTLSKADFVLTPSFTNSITLEPIGCGQEERQLHEKMKSVTQLFLTRLQEDLFANSGRLIRGLNYEPKK